MSKKNEDSLERFFRKAVAQHDTAFRESDWLKLEKMLDEKAAERAAGRMANLRRIGYSLAGLAIILTGIYLLTLNGNASMSTEAVLPKQVQVAAGEEAPVTDNVKEKPAAGLHSPAQSLADNRKEKESAPAEGAYASSTPDSGEEIRPGQNTVTPLPGKSSQPEAKESGSTKSQGINKDLTAVNAQANIHKPQPLPAQHPQDQGTERTGDSQNTVPSVIQGNDGPQTDKISKTNTAQTDNIPKTDLSLQQRTGSAENPRPMSTAMASETKTEDFNAAADVARKADVAPVAASQVADPDEGRKPLAHDDQRASQALNPAAQTHAENNHHATDGPAPEQEKIPLLKRADKDTVSVEEVIEELLPDEKMTPVPTRWNVALMLAPDFSSTALERYTAPGEAYGFAVGYRFLDRFTATTGLVRSTKKYVGYGSDYQPPEGYWDRRTNGIIPDDITGRCAILEIPLIVQYAISQRERSRVYFAAGISSYIMLSESYRYSFDTPNPNAARGWSTSKSSTYPFAIGHLSAAYERNLSQRWAIGLEPFLKIPFAGVGWTNVDLYSTGIFFNLRYRFFRKQQFTVPEERKQPIK